MLKRSARTIILAGLLGSMSFSASAETSAAPVAALYACASIAEDADRLACFDSAVDRLRAAEMAGEVQTVERSQIEEIERESFGFSLPSLPRLMRQAPDSQTAQESLSEIVSPVREASLRDRRAVIILENGQVWTQIDSTRVSSTRLRNAKTARIRRASLGSFLMRLDETGAAFRVRRTQ